MESRKKTSHKKDFADEIEEDIGEDEVQKSMPSAKISKTNLEVKYITKEVSS
jgi:hypothetical protein